MISKAEGNQAKTENENIILRNELKLYKALIENATDGVVLISGEGKFLYISPATKKMFGFNDEDILNFQPDKLTHPDDLPYVLEKLNNIIQNPDIKENVEYRFQSKDGSYKWIESTFSNMIHEPAVNAIVINFREIDERKKAEISLSKAKVAAEESNILKTVFLQNMSHELRTPMIGILGYSEFLEQELDEGEHRHFANIIHQSAKRLMDTFNLILSLSRIESGDFKIDIACFDLLEAVHEVGNFYYNKAVQHKIDFAIESQYQKLIGELDKTLFVSIITNLVNNALKYTDKGFVKVSICKEENESGDKVIIKVADSGIGISKEDQELIWKEFRQVSEGRGRKFEGVGLGLSLTRHYVEKMHGTITLESGLGKGSVFTVTLPLFLS